MTANGCRSAPEARRGVWTRGANALSLLRLLLAPLLALSLVRGDTRAAALCFALAVASDVADGWIARHLSRATPAGGAMDHAADAVFVSAGSAALAWLGQLPALLPPLIALAFLQYALDSDLPRRGALRASALGRINGIAYYALLGAAVARDALGLARPSAELLRAAGWLLALTTLASIADRALAWRRLRRGRRPD